VEGTTVTRRDIVLERTRVSNHRRVCSISVGRGAEAAFPGALVFVANVAVMVDRTLLVGGVVRGGEGYSDGSRTQWGLQGGDLASTTTETKPRMALTRVRKVRTTRVKEMMVLTGERMRDEAGFQPK
jgi:hypothetical protein